MILASGGAAALLALGVLLELFAPPVLAPPDSVLTTLAALVLAVGLPILIWATMQTGRVFRALERVRSFIVMMQTDEADAVPTPLPGEMPPEIERLLDAIDALIGGRLARQSLPVQQLESVLASIPDGILVINHAGLVGLVNAAAKSLLGADALTVGTSVYDVLSRSSLEHALGAAWHSDAAVDTEIFVVGGRKLHVRVANVGDGRGAVLVFDMSVPEQAHDIDYDLRLLEVPPELAAVSDSTPLDELPIFVFDLETTGLNVKTDTIVSVGGVRMVGTRIYRAATIDRLVRPDRPIPPRSTAIHGITDDMVAQAARFPDLWPVLARLMDGTILVGHNVGFDIAHIRAAAQRAGIDWAPPPYLCTYLLAAALDSGFSALTLDAIAREIGVTVRGRHTALGDSLMTAEVFARLQPQLVDRGITTLGAARAFSQRRKDLLKLQRESGWWTGEPR